MILVDYKRIRAELEASRYLTERHYLNMELSGCQSNLKAFWEIYRTVSQEAWRLDELYRDGLKKRTEELRGQKTA